VIGCPFFGSFLWANKEMNCSLNIMLIFYLLLLRAQKKKQEKGTRLSRPPAADTLRFSLLSGR